MEQDLTPSNVKLPRVVRLLKASDLTMWSDTFLLVGQLLGISEEVVYSISSTSSELERVWGMRFVNIPRHQWPPMTGTVVLSQKFMVVRASESVEEVDESVEQEMTVLEEEFEATSPWKRATPGKRSLCKPGSTSFTPVEAGSAQKSALVPLPREFRQLMSVGRKEEQQISLSSKTKFINMISWNVESSNKLSARIAAWRWLMSSLMIDEQTKGPYVFSCECWS